MLSSEEGDSAEQMEKERDSAGNAPSSDVPEVLHHIYFSFCYVHIQVLLMARTYM